MALKHRQASCDVHFDAILMVFEVAFESNLYHTKMHTEFIDKIHDYKVLITTFLGRQLIFLEVIGSFHWYIWLFLALYMAK